MDFIKVLCEGTMRAATEIITNRRIVLEDEAHLERLVKVMRDEINGNYSTLVADLKAVNDSGMPESMLRKMINVECNLYAVRSLKSCGLLPRENDNPPVFGEPGFSELDEERRLAERE